MGLDPCCAVLRASSTRSARTRFPRGKAEDAIVNFATRDGRVTGVTMKALSPLADFSFDDHDLAFVPVESSESS